LGKKVGDPNTFLVEQMATFVKAVKSSGRFLLPHISGSLPPPQVDLARIPKTEF
jgi:hypothetical protein